MRHKGSYSSTNYDHVDERSLWTQFKIGRRISKNVVHSGGQGIVSKQSILSFRDTSPCVAFSIKEEYQIIIKCDHQ